MSELHLHYRAFSVRRVLYPDSWNTQKPFVVKLSHWAAPSVQLRRFILVVPQKDWGEKKKENIMTSIDWEC